MSVAERLLLMTGLLSGGLWCQNNVQNVLRRPAPPPPPHPHSEFENDKLRVIRIQSRPNESTLVFRDALLVCIRGCQFRLITPDKPPREVLLDSGNNLWIGIGQQPARLLNNSTQSIEALLIEPIGKPAR